MRLVTPHPAPATLAPARRTKTVVPAPDERLDFLAGLYRLIDPKITLASAAAILLAACGAAAHGPIAWRWLALVIGGVFAVEAAKNASGEIFDWNSGADQGVSAEQRTPFSGGKRVLVGGLLTRRQVAAIAAVGYALAIAAGVVVAWLREPRVLWIGLAGLACAWFYHAPPLTLSYRGLGELAVALCYGPLLVAGTCLVLGHDLCPATLAASLPLGVLVAAFLFVNELPDAAADAAAGKRTLVVRLGRRRAAKLFGWILASAFVLLLALPLFGVPVEVLGGLLALPVAGLAAAAARGAKGDVRRLVPAQAGTLIAFLLYAAGAGVGLLLAGTSP